MNKLLKEKLKFKRVKCDPCIYARGEKEEMITLSVYVDDIIIMAKEDAIISAIKSAIDNEFKIDDIGECRKIIGMHVICEKSFIILHQMPFIKEVLREANIIDCKTKRSPLNNGERMKRCTDEKKGPKCGLVNGTEFRSYIGKLNYLA